MIQRKFILFIVSVLLLATARGSAQYENIWVFGDHAGLDFNTNTPTPIKTSITGFGEASASVCDANGQLLFYTEGYRVWDKNGNLMPNGSALLPFNYNDNDGPTSSSAQGAVIIPYPDHPHKYFIFSLTARELASYRKVGWLYYSIIDMNLNNGLGDVVPSSKGIFLDSGLSEAMTAVIGDRCNIWLIVQSRASRTLKTFEITDAGLNKIPVLSPLAPTFGTGGFGCIAISPDRKKLAITADGAYGLYLYDFNPISGTVTNEIPLLPFWQGYGVCFSPDNLKLYVNSAFERCIYQYDLTSGNAASIAGSQTYIGKGLSTHLKLASNGKIYFRILADSSNILGSINYPDRVSQSCGYTEDAIVLVNGTKMGAGLPNVIPVFKHNRNYRVQDIHNKCFANMNQLNIHASNDTTGWDYLWNTGTTSPELTADTPGTYWITYHTPPCNFNADTFHVSFPNGVLPDLTIDTACINSANGRAYATTYPGDTVTYHYYWQNQRGDTLSLTDTLQHVPSGNYTLRVTTAHCDTTLALYIPEVDYRVSFQADSIICQGTKLHFTNTSDSSFTRFSWNFGDGDHSLLRSPGHLYNRTGSYEVILVGKGKICTDTANKTIIVDSLYSGTFLKEPDNVCVGQEAISFYPHTDSTALSLHWNFGDGSEMISEKEKKIQHAYETAGNFPVRLTTRFRACPDTSFADTVYVYPLPKVDLGPDSSLCLNGSPVILQNRQTLPAGTYHYHWSTGDTTEKLKAVHPGIYRLAVNAEPLGCSNSASIKITKDCYIDIPNAFTPNGDGENDYFFPRQLLAKKVTQFHMQIFNRWGELIFETGKINGRGWDGRFNGKPQPQGVYVYIIDAEIDGTRMEYYQGNVTLIR